MATREVETRFTAKDAGHGRVVSDLSKAYEASTKKLESMRQRFSDFRRESGLNIAAMLGFGIGIAAIIEKMKESQAEFDHTQKGIAGVLSSALKFEKGASEIDRFNRSMVLSKQITGDLEHISGRFVMSLDDVANTYREVAVSAGSLGLTQKQVMTLTEEAAATAKRFGVDGVTAATSIARALQMGSVRGFDPFNTRLRQSLGNMKHLTQAQRFEHIEKALHGSVQIADKMGEGVGGSLGRIRIAAGELIRDLSTPLFKEIASTLERWAQHLREAQDSGQPLIEVYANRLVEAFKLAERITSQIFSHWKEIAVVWAGFKGAQFGSALGRAGGGKGLGGKLTGGLAGGGAIGLLGAVGGLYAEDYAKRQMLSSEKEGDLGRFAGVMTSARRLQEMQRGPLSSIMDARSGGITPEYAEAVRDFTKAIREQKLDKSFEAVSELAGTARTFKEEAAKAFGMPSDQVEALTSSLQRLISSVRGEDADDMSWLKPRDKNLAFAKNVQNFYGGINVQIKTEESDPDRIFVRFQQGLNDMTDKRAQALGAEPQGM